MRKICLILLLLPTLAWAEPKTASEWFKEGDNQYNLGNFDKAIEAFKRAFELETNQSNRAIYLYNVAQSYRKANDCKNAQFFYRRFLSLKDSDTAKPLSPEKRREVQDRLEELEACVQAAQAIGRKPPDSNLPPDTSDTGRKEAPTQVAKSTEHEPEPEDGGEHEPIPVRAAAPHVFAARASGGVAAVNAGNLDVPAQFTLAVLAGYPVSIDDKLTIELGGAFTFTPVPFKENGMFPAKTVQMYGLLANAGLSYWFTPKVAARLDAGIGALLLANASETGFVQNNNKTSGALSMLHIRGAVSLDYAVTPNVVLTATPFAFTWSPPKDGLEDSVDSIISLDFMVGVGYRM